MYRTNRTALGLGALLATTIALTAGSASAHTGVGPTAGLQAGFLHPLFGLDHLLAMLAAGIWASQLGGRARWALPAAFLALIAAGMALGMLTGAVAGVELAILLSLAALGLLVAFEARLRTVGAAGLVGLFALFHGHAHGAEAAGFGYAMGALVATALLLAAGLGLHWALRRWGARAAGVVAVLAAVALGA